MFDLIINKCKASMVSILTLIHRIPKEMLVPCRRQ